MANPEPLSTSILRGDLRKLALTTLLLYALTITAAVPAAQAQTFTVLHSFTRLPTGFGPRSGLVPDGTGSRYGTTSNDANGGSAYELTHGPSGWVVSTVTEFAHDGNGYAPMSRLTLGPDGALYGTTQYGGTPGSCGGLGCGAIFRLNPSAAYSRTTIYRFSGPDGYWPAGELTFDRTGDIFGTTLAGGAYGGGTVFELVRNSNGWTESVIHGFDGSNDGGELMGGVIIDPAGNLYGTAYFGGDRTCLCGLVFELSPSAGSWSYRELHVFQGAADGAWPKNGLIMDGSGNLYGTTSDQGPFGGSGTVFELSPSGDYWNLTTIRGFSGGSGTNPGPAGGVILDASGNLYGTTYATGFYGQGSVFELTPIAGGWNYTTLHDFFDLIHDGQYPVGNLLRDAHGNIFGTTSQGGDYGGGTVWEITP